MLGSKRQFVYPFSKKFVYYSIFLIGASFGLMLLVILPSFDLSILMSYLLVTAIVSLFVLVIKFYLYSQKTDELVPMDSSAKEERGIPMWMMVLLIMFGLILVLIAFFLLGPLNWYIVLTSLIAGLNIPEIILYCYASRIKIREI